jgi:PAS domain S-box-containing protein
MTKSISKSSTGVLADLTSEAVMKVLHVDDDLNFLKVAKQCLEMHGRFQVDTARSAEEALEKVKKETYDAIVSDYLMPGKNGLEFLKELRDEGNDVPFIILTGKGREEVAIKALNLGADGYFGKYGDAETVYGELEHGISVVVEKKRIEDALRASQAKYKSLLQNIPGMVYRARPDWSTEITSNSKNVCGYAIQEFDSGTVNWLDIIHPDDKARVVKEGGIILEGPASITQEYRVLDKDGEVRWVEDQKTSFFSENGAFLGIDGVVFDITQRKKTEQALRTSLDRYQSFIELTGQFGWTTNGEGEAVEDVPSFRKFTGQTYEEMKGWGWSKALHPDDLERTTRIWKEATAVKSRYEAEFRLRRHDGVYRYFMARSVPVFNEDGSIREWVGTLIDITERKRSEEALQDAKEKWASLTENTDDIVMITDNKGVIQFVNRTISPYTPEETVGKTVYEYVPREQHNVLEKSFREVFKTGKPESYEVSSSIPTVGTIWFRTKVVPIKHDGKVSSAILISANITDQKNAEEELCRAMKKLDVTNEKLRVVGGLARHDVRNKLVGVTGNAYLLRRRFAEDPKALEQLRDMEAAVLQVERIFEFATAYEKLGVEQLTYMDIGKTIDEAVSLFSDLKGVKIMNECLELAVLGDSLLRQLFYNLIDNSLKHGEKIKQIKFHCEMPSADELELVYEDDGVGIPSDMRNSLFKEDVGKGTGYGLFMIKRIIEVYGWNIQEAGTQGKGVKFVITIPKTNLNGKENYRIV